MAGRLAGRAARQIRVLAAGGGESATVTDVFGQASTVTSQNGQIRLPVSGTPLFVAKRSASPGPALS